MSAGVPSSTVEPPRLASGRLRRPRGGSAFVTAPRPGSRLALLVLAGQVHPEQHAAQLGRPALAELLLTDPLGVPDAPPRPELQQRALGQPRPFDRPARTGAVAGARRSLEDVPEVVEPAVGVVGVDFARSERRDRASWTRMKGSTVRTGRSGPGRARALRGPSSAGRERVQRARRRAPSPGAELPSEMLLPG